MTSCSHYDNMLIERGEKVHMRFGDSHEPLKNMNDNCYSSKYLLQQVKETCKGLLLKKYTFESNMK